MSEPHPSRRRRIDDVLSDSDVQKPQLIDSKDHTEYIARRNADGSLAVNKPIGAYAVGPGYSKGKPALVQPKRPLGSRRRANQPMHMYSQIAGVGAMDRIRRPRLNIPVEESDDESVSLMQRASMLWSKSRAVALGALAFVGARVEAAGSVVLHGLLSIPLGRGRTIYGVFRGARFERFGIARSWFKYVIPLVVVVFLLGLAIFNNWLGDLTHSPGQIRGGKGGGGNNGIVTLQVDNSASKSGGTGSGQNGSNAGHGSAGSTGSNASPQQSAAGAGSTASGSGPSGSASGGSSVQQGGGAGGASYSAQGGYGGGGGASGGSLPVTSGSGGGVVSQPVTAPVPSSPISVPTGGSSGSGGCSSCSGGGSTTPLPVTAPTSPVTAPDPTPVLNQTLAPVTQSVPTAPVTNTLNSTTQNLNSTTNSLGL